jgi:hypothetical protein
MPEEKEFSLSSEIEKIRRAGRGEYETAPQPTREEQAAARAKLEDEEFARAEREPERRKDVARLAATRTALRNAVSRFRHGVSYDDAERKAIVGEAVALLGGELSATQRQAIAGAVNTAADAIRQGDRMSGMRAAEAAVDAIVQDKGRISMTIAAGETPEELAAKIERM